MVVGKGLGYYRYERLQHIYKERERERERDKFEINFNKKINKELP